MAKPGQPLPDALGLLPTVEQVAAAPPRRSKRQTYNQLGGFGGQTRTGEGYPKKKRGRTSHIFRHEWENKRAVHTSTVTNALRRAGLDPKPDK